MTTTTAAAPAAHRPPSLPRLCAVELRKMWDTRAGFWLLATVALIAVAIVALIVAVGDDDERHFADMFAAALGLISLVLPVVGILAVTSEWSQRTGLATFTLVPRRGRVVAAKLAAATGLTALAVAACALAAAAGTLVAGGDWGIDASLVANGALYELIAMIGGVAFGLVVLSSPLAIVLYFVLPIAWSILGESIGALDSAARWLDLGRTTTPLVEGGMGGEEWARLGTSTGLWVGLVLVVGLVRLMRSEVR